MRWIDLPWSEEKSSSALSLIIDNNQNLKSYHKLWVVLCKSSGEKVGVIGLSKLVSESFKRDIGIMLMPSSQKKGAAQEIMNTIMDYGHSGLGLTKISCKIHIEHTACIRLAERLNFIPQFKRDQWSFWEKDLEQ